MWVPHNPKLKNPKGRILKAQILKWRPLSAGPQIIAFSTLIVCAFEQCRSVNENLDIIEYAGYIHVYVYIHMIPMIVAQLFGTSTSQNDSNQFQRPQNQ